jgi:hypothetical protein
VHDLNIKVNCVTGSNTIIRFSDSNPFFLENDIDWLRLLLLSKNQHSKSPGKASVFLTLQIQDLNEFPEEPPDKSEGR